jgi:hypothetical protein
MRRLRDGRQLHLPDLSGWMRREETILQVHLQSSWRISERVRMQGRVQMIPRIPRHEIPLALVVAFLTFILWSMGARVGYQTYQMMKHRTVQEYVQKP